MVISSKPTTVSNKVKLPFTSVGSLVKITPAFKILFFFLSSCVQYNYWCYQIQGDLPLLPLKGNQSYYSSFLGFSFFVFWQSKAFFELLSWTSKNTLTCKEFIQLR